MKIRLLSVLLVLALAFGALSFTAFAEEKSFSDCEVKIDGESWKVFPVESLQDWLYVDDLNITVEDRFGNVISPDDYILNIGEQVDWDDELDAPIFSEVPEPYGVDSYASDDGFTTYCVSAVAKNESSYKGSTESRNFMIWHKYSINWFGATTDFGQQYKGSSQWYWHDYYVIPEGQIQQPVVYDIAGERIDPSQYTITYYHRSSVIPDSDDPEYDEKLYPNTDPMTELPSDPGCYYAVIEAAEDSAYYGSSAVDFDILRSYAQVRGESKRYYDGDTIYMEQGDEIYVSFGLDPAVDGMTAGWFSDQLRNAGFTIDEPVNFDGDDRAFVRINSDNVAPGTEAELPYTWYNFWDVFDGNGFHWDTAVPKMNASVKITVTPQTYDYLLGDADGDGIVSVIDASVLQRRIAGLPMSFDENTLMHGDVDRNDALEIVDVTYIQRWLANLRVPYEVGNPIIL